METTFSRPQSKLVTGGFIRAPISSFCIMARHRPAQPLRLSAFTRYATLPAMKSPRRHRHADAWKAAEAAGCDMKQVAYNLTLTPAERLRQHGQKLAALLAEEATEKRHRRREQRRGKRKRT